MGIVTTIVDDQWMIFVYIWWVIEQLYPPVSSNMVCWKINPAIDFHDKNPAGWASVESPGNSKERHTIFFRTTNQF